MEVGDAAITIAVLAYFCRGRSSGESLDHP
jgi:hypothetical protein